MSDSPSPQAKKFHNAFLYVFSLRFVVYIFSRYLMPGNPFFSGKTIVSILNE